MIGHRIRPGLYIVRKYRFDDEVYDGLWEFQHNRDDMFPKISFETPSRPDINNKGNWTNDLFSMYTIFDDEDIF